MAFEVASGIVLAVDFVQQMAESHRIADIRGTAEVQAIAEMQRIAGTQGRIHIPVTVDTLRVEAHLT